MAGKHTGEDDGQHAVMWPWIVGCWAGTIAAFGIAATVTLRLVGVL